MVPVHKKCDKQVSRNYRPVSLLSKCRKIFEYLIIICLNFLLKTIQYHLTNQGLSKVTRVYISFYLVHIKFINRLTTVLQLEVFFEFEKWRAFRANIGGVLAWMTC